MQRRNTRQRRLVLEAVQSLAGAHPTADEVFVEARQHDEHLSRGTVYRNLALLSDEGCIRTLKTRRLLPQQLCLAPAAATRPQRLFYMVGERNVSLCALEHGDGFYVLCMREHVHRRKPQQAIPARPQDFEVARLRRGVATNIYDASRAYGHRRF